MIDGLAVVLHSGGQDSTTCLYLARRDFKYVVALSVDYGQRHASEVEAAAAIASLAGADHVRLDARSFGEAAAARSALIGSDRAIEPAGGLEDDQVAGGLPTSYVPGRNALLLTLAATVAAVRGGRDIYAGVCEADYSGYPDCRAPFVEAMQQALSLSMPSSLRPLRLHTPLLRRRKAAIVRLARTLPGCWDALALTVTCYHGRRPGCGACPACLLRRKGFEEAGWLDPAEVP